MALEYYKAYLNSMAQDPVTYWRELRQEATNDVWLDTSTIETVQGQTSLGAISYGPESVQVNSVIDPKTGKPFGDDYRKIIYKNLFDNKLPPSIIPASQFLVNSVGGIELYRFETIDGKDFLVRNSNRFMGKYYKFDGITWLTINTNTIIGSSASAILQRCNNWLKWYDKNNVLHQWECVFERSLSSTGFDYGSEGVAEVGSDTLIRVQRNAETELIPFNQRFIFDGHAFQVKQINNHISDTYMELYLFETQIQSNDDLVNNIANSDGEIKPTTNETLITPDVNKILQGETQKFSVYNYINGVPSSSTYKIDVLGGSADVNYTLTIIDGNNFSITNILQSNLPLTIVCTNTQDSSDIVSINIILGGLW